MADDDLVTTRVEARVGIVTICNPPVNAFHPQLLKRLEAAVVECQANSAIEAIVLCGANGRFSAGYDINLFLTQGLETLQRRDSVTDFLTHRVERGDKPVVAALCRVALGAGLELALACAARVCSQDALLALPEIRLGVLPGLGGTQRLVRLAGLDRGLECMLQGTYLSAAQALDAGVVDQVVLGTSDEVVAAAKKLALDVARGSRPRRQALSLPLTADASGEGEPPSRELLDDRAAARILQRYRAEASRPLAALRARSLLVQAVRAGCEQGADAGMAQEGALFARLAFLPEHRAMVRAFLAARAARKKRLVSWCWYVILAFCYQAVAWVCALLHVGWDRE